MDSGAALPPAHVLNAVVAHVTTSLQATRAMSAALHPTEGLPDLVAGQQHYEAARATLVAGQQVLAAWVMEPV